MSLTKSGAVLFVVPKSPTLLLASLTNDFGSDVASKVFVTHGHACVVLFLSDPSEATPLLSVLHDNISGYELWPLADGVVVEPSIVLQEPPTSPNWQPPVPIDVTGLHFDARSQIEQFNTNLALLSRIASEYANEVSPLIDSLHESVSDICGSLIKIAESSEADAIREGIRLESALIETNSILTTYCSQLGSGALPLRSQTFAVGEYSLVGIGAMCRAVWRIYSHLSTTFGAHDHLGVLKRAYRTARGFNPYSGASRIDFSDWRTAELNLEHLSDGSGGPFRQHIPYFSSRWGFHEGLHSISLSWQCLYASATKEWNLLTLTHEFLHSHMRGILGLILSPDAGSPNLAADICDRFNRGDQGETMLHSMRIAYVEALVGLHGAFNLAAQTSGTSPESPMTIQRRSVDPDRLANLNREHADLVNEIMVHVLDYRYVYNGRDAEYVNSIWSSWSLVPGVVDRVEQYVLRTLCALSSISPIEYSPQQVFEDVVERLRQQLTAMAGRPRTRHAISAALALVDDPEGLARLKVLLPAATYVVQLTTNFLLDSRLNAALVMDDLTTIEDNRRTYNIEAGNFRGEHISSPIGFLLDRFPDCADQPGNEVVDYESIWQMLQLI